MSNLFARAYLYFTSLIIGLVALAGIAHHTLPDSFRLLWPVLQSVSPLTCSFFLALALSLSLYLKAPLTSRMLALGVVITTLGLLLALKLPDFQTKLTALWPSLNPLPPELNTAALTLLLMASLLLCQHPSVFAESLAGFVIAQVLSLGLVSTSLLLLGYSWLTPHRLLNLPLGIAFFLIGHSMGLLTYRIFTRVLSPPHRLRQASQLEAASPYRTLLTKSAIGVWELNLSTQALRLDQQTVELYGLNPAKAPFTLADWLSIVHPGDVSLLQTTLQQAAQQDQPIDVIFRTAPNNRPLHHIRMRAQHLRTNQHPSGVLLGISFDVTAQAQQTLNLNQLNAILMQYAYYDSLTGLMNRHAFTDAAQHVLAEAQRQEFKLAGFFIDLDWFKTINDVHGHRMGDRVLVAIAKRITRTLRAEDLVCRLGGDEFFALLGHIHSDNHARHIAEKLIAEIQQPIRLNGLELRVGASIGIACFPDHAPSIAILMERADEAMQQAKRLGKGRCAYYAEQ